MFDFKKLLDDYDLFESEPFIAFRKQENGDITQFNLGCGAFIAAFIAVCLVLFLATW